MKTTIILIATVFAFSSSIAGGSEESKETKMENQKKEVSLYSRASFTCYNGEGISFKEKKGLPRSSFTKRGKKFCAQKCSKVTKKCGINSSQVTGFVGLFRNDLYKQVQYSCLNLEKTYKQTGKTCHTSAEWKKIALVRCTKLVGKLPGALNSHEVSNKCKVRKNIEQSNEKTQEFLSNVTSSNNK